MFCKKCGANIEPGNKFCMKCGTKVDDVSVKPEPVVYAQPQAPAESVQTEYVPLQPEPVIAEKVKKEKNPLKAVLVALRLIIALIWAGAEWAVYSLIQYDQFGIRFAATVSVTLVTWVILVIVTNTLGRKIIK